MKERTLEIIIVCKGNTRYDSEVSLVDSVKNYMSDICMCAKEWYTDSQMEEILREAFYDFIDVCDIPSYFLRRLEEVKWINPNLAERICMVFRTTQVLDGYMYINGFNADYEKIAENLR